MSDRLNDEVHIFAIRFLAPSTPPHQLCRVNQCRSCRRGRSAGTMCSRIPPFSSPPSSALMQVSPDAHHVCAVQYSHSVTSGHRALTLIMMLFPAANTNPASSPNLKGAADDIVPFFEMLSECLPATSRATSRGIVGDTTVRSDEELAVNVLRYGKILSRKLENRMQVTRWAANPSAAFANASRCRSKKSIWDSLFRFLPPSLRCLAALRAKPAGASPPPQQVQHPHSCLCRPKRNVFFTA